MELPSATPEAPKAALVESAFSWRLSTSAQWVVLFTIVATILRVSFLDSKSFWLDEGLTATRVTLPINSLLDVLTHGQMNMFLYYLMLHGWTLIAGSSESMLRFPSVILGVAVVPLIYALGVSLSDRRAGLMAALLMTTNATSIRYAQTARSYSMFVALATLGSIYFIRTVKRGSLTTFLGYVTSETASVYVHLFGIFALPCQGIWLALFRRRVKSTIRLTVCMATIGVLSLPEFYFAIKGDFGNEDWVRRTSLRAVAELFLIFAGAFDERVTILTVVLTALFLIGVALAVRWAQRDDWSSVGYLLLSICVPIVLTVAVSIFKPLFVARYLLAGLPLFVLLAAFGFRRLRPPFAIALMFAISALSLAQDYSYYRAPSIQDWRGAVNFVATHSQPGDMLAIYPTYYDGPIRYYFSRRAHPETFPTRILLESIRKAGEDPARTLAKSGLDSTRRLWFTFPAWDASGENVVGLLHRGQVIEEKGFAGVRLFLLEKSH